MTRPYLYLDIETIPTTDPEIIAQIAADITPPAAMKKADTIAAWVANDKAAAVEAAVAKTSLEGAFGRVAVIGLAMGNTDPTHVNLADFDGEDRAEAMVLGDFVEALLDTYNPARSRPPVIVGHNVAGFDIRFITQRAMVLGVEMPAWWPRDPKPWSDDVHDTMHMWAGAKGFVGLDKLCRVFGVAGKDGMDGSQVGPAWAAGEYQKVIDYCLDDVRRVREIHRRMMRAYGEAA